MEKEKPFPTEEELKTKQEDIARKVEEQAKQKAELLRKQLNELDLNLDSLEYLDKYLEKAKENLNFYEKLEQKGLLSSENKPDLEEARKLVKKVQETIEGKKEESKNIMKISEVGEKVEEMAKEEDKEFENNKRIEEIREKTANWAEDFIGQVEEVKTKLQEKLVPLEESENKLEELLNEKLKNIGKNFHVNSDLRKELEEYINELGFFQRRPVKAVLGSNELSVYEKYQKDLESLKIKNEWGYNHPFTVIHHVFNNSSELRDELSNIRHIVSKQERDLYYRVEPTIRETLKSTGEMGKSIESYLEMLDIAKK